MIFTFRGSRDFCPRTHTVETEISFRSPDDPLPLTKLLLKSYLHVTYLNMALSVSINHQELEGRGEGLECSLLKCRVKDKTWE